MADSVCVCVYVCVYLPTPSAVCVCVYVCVYVCVCVCVCVCVFTNPIRRAWMRSKLNFLVEFNLNSEFSFSKTGCLATANKSSLPYINP